ncbi:MAG: Txe/YoeB family addiction module toxin [Lactobacillaceae bacterium]|jgi:Txe/YoeB family toxin of toxin-antitoxin system|nr:Txe/YoeB family addiction module toxin [Lactobacillaceae bacterium]
MYRIEIKNSAKSDLKKIKNAKLISQFEKVRNQLQLNPFEPNQYFERLTPPGTGKYSRRINHQHRVVYKVDVEEKIVQILSAYGHY